jgi:membrane protein DedA with SNARE-associated domain
MEITMHNSLSPELFWLTLTVLMTSLFWIPYIINRMLELGILNALWDRFGLTSTKKDWAQRMMQAHEMQLKI